MSRTRAIVVRYSEVFNYAEREFGIPWNTCCTMYHADEIFEYGSMTQWYADGLPDGWDKMDKETILELAYDKKAVVIVEKFMVAEGLQDTPVLIDSQ